MLENSAIETLLYTTLNTTVSGMPFYVGYAPEQETKPFILAQYISAEDVNCGYGTVIGGFYRYLIEVYAEGESFPYTESENIFELLDGLTDTVDGVSLIIRRERVSTTTEQYDGHEIRRAGGVYKIIARRTA